tara:strand:- start:236 stop:745 length:510 start_codon:yes stop_codon:yes gene_type:complete
MEDSTIIRLVAAALEGAARNIRQEFPATAPPPESAEEYRQRAEERAALPAKPEPKPKRTVTRVKDADRRDVMCADGQERKWYASAAMRSCLQAFHRDGVVDNAYLCPASQGLGVKVQRFYYGDRDPQGVLISPTEKVLYAESGFYPVKKGKAADRRADADAEPREGREE